MNKNTAILNLLKAETGSLIWASLCMTGSGIGALLCIIFLIYINWTYGEDHISTPGDGLAPVGYFGANLVYGVALILCAIEFIFSTFLLVGVIRKNVAYVNSYIVFGVVKTIIAGAVACESLLGKPIDNLFILIVIMFALHSLILLMVRKTYSNLKSEQCTKKLLV